MSDKSWNGQTYECPTHGLLTGEEVNEDEVDYGELDHYCMKCYAKVPYVGYRSTPESKPFKRKKI